MKRKIAINAAERTLIVAALIAYDMPYFAAESKTALKKQTPPTMDPKSLF